MNKPFSSSHVKWYVIISIISLTFWISLFSSLNRVVDTEKIEIFITAETFDRQIESLLLSDLEINGVKKVNVTLVNKNDSDYQTILSTKGVNTCDLLILPKSFIENFNIKDQFVSFTEALLNNYEIDIAQYDVYKEDDSIYGIEIFSQSTTNNISRFITFGNALDDKYYLFMNKETPNSGEFSAAYNKYTDNAYYAMKSFLSVIK